MNARVPYQFQNGQIGTCAGLTFSSNAVGWYFFVKNKKKERTFFKRNRFVFSGNADLGSSGAISISSGTAALGDSGDLTLATGNSAASAAGSVSMKAGQSGAGIGGS